MATFAMRNSSFANALNNSREAIGNEIWAISILLRGSTALIKEDAKELFRGASEKIKGFGGEFSFKFREALTRNELIGTAPSMMAGSCPCTPCAVGFSLAAVAATIAYTIKGGSVRSVFKNFRHQGSHSSL